MDSARPLSGQTIVVTRARAQAGKLAQALESAGARVIEFPTIDIRFLNPKVLPNTKFDWVIFTSANGVRAFLEGSRSATEILAETKVCAVGPATKESLAEHDIACDLVPQHFDALGIAEALSQLLPSLDGVQILLPRGRIAQPDLPDALRAMKAEVTEHVVYDTVCPGVSDSDCDRLVEAAPHWVTFTSASTAGNFAATLDMDRLQRLANTTRYASIGTQTSEACRNAGLAVAVEAKEHTVPGLVSAIIDSTSTEGTTHARG